MMCNAVYQFGNEDIGFCTVIVRHPPRVENPTEEDIALVQRNRQEICNVLSRIESKIHGQPMEVSVDFRDDLYENGIPETLTEMQKIVEKVKEEKAV